MEVSRWKSYANVKSKVGSNVGVQGRGSSDVGILQWSARGTSAENKWKSFWHIANVFQLPSCMHMVAVSLSLVTLS